MTAPALHRIRISLMWLRNMSLSMPEERIWAYVNTSERSFFIASSDSE